MGVKTNFVLSIAALVIAIVGCVLVVRLFFPESPPLSEERVSVLIEEKTRTYITEEKIKEIFEQLMGKLKETVVEREEWEQRIGELEKRRGEVEQLLGELEEKERETEQLVGRLEKVVAKEKELNQQVTKLEEKEKEVEQLIGKLKEKAYPSEIVIMKDIYRISLLRSSVNQRYKDPEGPDQYVLVFVDGERIIKTRVVQNTFCVKWWPDYRKEVVLEKFVKGDRALWWGEIEVYLMDEDPEEDDVIGHWTVSDPLELEKLLTDGSSVEFIVEKIGEKMARTLEKECGSNKGLKKEEGG